MEEEITKNIMKNTCRRSSISGSIWIQLRTFFLNNPRSVKLEKLEPLLPLPCLEQMEAPTTFRWVAKPSRRM
jgi:hypothetical protein